MKSYLKKSISLIIVVIIIYILAVRYDLFFILPWIDKTAHLIGGCAIGYMSLFLLEAKLKKRIIFGSLFALSIGIGWEIFERIGHSYLPHYINYGGRLDTSLDILCAILGASFIIIINHFHDRT